MLMCSIIYIAIRLYNRSPFVLAGIGVDRLVFGEDNVSTELREIPAHPASIASTVALDRITRDASFGPVLHPCDGKAIDKLRGDL